MNQPPIIAESRRLRDLRDAKPARILVDGEAMLTRQCKTVGMIDNVIVEVIAVLHATLHDFCSRSGYGRPLNYHLLEKYWVCII